MDICGFFALFKLASKIVVSSLHGNATGLLGFSAYQNISTATRVIAYGIRADYTDEYLHIGEDTTIKCVELFAKTMTRVFGPEYLRAPNEDTKKLMGSNEEREWMGMLESIDCMH